jgi:hypothetical protein
MGFLGNLGTRLEFGGGHASLNGRQTRQGKNDHGSRRLSAKRREGKAKDWLEPHGIPCPVLAEPTILS